MALVLADRVKVRTRTTGTGPFTLENTVEGYQSFAAVGDGNETYYGIYDTRGQWEIGRGIYTAATSRLTRDFIVSSSNNNNRVNFLPGSKTVYTTLPSSVVNSLVASSMSDSFKYIAVAGQETVVADAPTDTLTLVAGQNISIATDISTDQITINFTGDYTGSVFADSSTMIIDGTEGKVIGDISTSTLRTSETGILLGFGAGSTNPGLETLAIGKNAGNTNQGDYSVALGSLAGNTGQGSASVALGISAGQQNQSTNSVALGAYSGSISQGIGSVALGKSAGNNSQGQASVAIGLEAGQTSQGHHAIALGVYAGKTNQPANSIILNAQSTGTTVADTLPLEPTTSGFFVAPIRNLTTTGQILNYNPVTKEISYSQVIEADLTGSVFSDSSTMLVDAVAGRHYGPLTGDVTGSVFADNNFKMIDAAQARHYGPLTGNVTGDVTGNVTGTLTGPSIGFHTGDVKGSVFADDSSVIIDGTQGAVIGPVSTGYNIEISKNNGTLSFIGSGTHAVSTTAELSIQGNTLSITSTSGTTLSTLAGDITLNPASNVVIQTGKTLTGNVNVTGTLAGVVDGEMIGSVYADDSTRVFDATNNTISTRVLTTTLYTKFPAYATATDRNTAIPTPSIGMVVVTGSSLTLYNGSTWVTLLATA